MRYSTRQLIIPLLGVTFFCGILGGLSIAEDAPMVRAAKDAAVVDALRKNVCTPRGFCCTAKPAS
jgi:hypothetical protein